jgi:hypothetical protein
VNQWTPIAAAVQNVMPAVPAALPWPSLFTAQEPVPTIGPTGAVEFDYVNVSDPTLINIPCTAPPESASSIVATEVRELADIHASELHHVLLNGYYPSLDAGWRGENADGKGAWIALIDGTAYEINGVESDSQSQMTRVRVKLATV